MPDGAGKLISESKRSSRCRRIHRDDQTGCGSWGSPISQTFQNLTLDGNPSTWEQISFTDTTPVGATWVGVQVAFTNSTIRPDYSGYVDDASLVVPEPGSLLAISTSVIAMAGTVLRRRRS